MQDHTPIFGWILIGIVWTVLAVLFGIYDLQISQTLYDPSSEWAQFGEDWGQIPSFFFIGIVFLLLLYSFTLNKENALRRELMAFSFVVFLLTIICPLLIVQSLKLFVKRVRFRCLDASFSQYTPWFASPIELSYTSCYTSFPSGHTAQAFMFLPLIIPFRKTGLKWVMVILTVGWGIFVGASRVVIGAHYASDVLFSAFFSIVITLLLYNLLYGREDQMMMDFNCPCLDQEICWCKDIGK